MRGGTEKLCVLVDVFFSVSLFWGDFGQEFWKACHAFVNWDGIDFKLGVSTSCLEYSEWTLSPRQTSSNFRIQHATFVGHSVAHCCMSLGLCVVKRTEHFAVTFVPN